MEERKTEERFEVALRCLCERWGCFDLMQPVRGGISSFVDEGAPEAQVQVPQSNGIRVRGSDLARLLKSDIDQFGSIAAIKRRLSEENQDENSLVFAANNRLDLTFESFSLRPAWRGLFDKTEQRIAADRLLKLMSFASQNELIPSPGGDLSRTVDYLNEQIISWETDHELPNSKVPYGPAWQVEDTEQTWCESVADSGRAYDEIGLIRTSLKQCDHYFGCSRCAQAWPQLDKLFLQYQRKTFCACQEVLKVLRACLDRADSPPPSRAFGAGDEFAWRVIVCAAGAMYNESVRSVQCALSELESGYIFGTILHNALTGMGLEDIDALSLAEAASQPFMELQWFLYGDDDLIYLPSDGDLTEVPGAVAILPSTQLDEWKRLMTGSDLVFQKSFNDGTASALNIDGYGLLRTLSQAACFLSQSHREALALTTIKEELPPPVGSTRDIRTTVKEAREQDLDSVKHEESNIEDRLLPKPERLGPTIRSLADRVIGLTDMVASNSAAQIPIIDTLQALLSRSDGPSRFRAEQSIREVLGDPVYDWLCPHARLAVIVAEYHWLDPNFPDPSRIVADLALAFEIQLRTSIFGLFCVILKSSGIWIYPEPPDSPPQLKANEPLSAHERFVVRLPILLKKGVMKSTLTLGEMKCHLDRPLPRFSAFLEQQSINAQRISKILPEVTAMRNPAVHQGASLIREEVSDIRHRWLGATSSSWNIFAAIMPGGWPGPSQM
jgi:hypothetical protein